MGFSNTNHFLYGEMVVDGNTLKIKAWKWNGKSLKLRVYLENHSYIIDKLRDTYNMLTFFYCQDYQK